MFPKGIQVKGVKVKDRIQLAQQQTLSYILDNLHGPNVPTRVLNVSGRVRQMSASKQVARAEKDATHCCWLCRQQQ